MKVFIAAVASASLLAGCATKSENVVAQYQSPAKYRHLSCDEISTELERVSTNVMQLADAQDDARVRDQVATGVGIVLFWPALFVLAADDKEHELAQMKGEFEALETAYAQQRCTSKPAMAAATPVSLSPADIGMTSAADAPRQQVSYAAVPDGVPAPFEGARLSSYTASDMRWFCKQDWRSRMSPEGRTEYNPCHVPEMFIR